ncbi:AMP-binding protein [Haloactinomyces albus]|uniref:Long-chain acyl-CoA synthetase n=1 Tax=Haloactinomyces albus TaxID=1352928 RepID=A0AAE3ZAA8_9ACTN|nr:AMP-binding protein [Haloactinomyces albus]MDR7299896.1 long-chain acyl-CoA synthetase [Haloactinomyces albus]
MPDSADETLRRLYAQVLAVDTAGDDEGFFELGGTSLHVVRLLELVHEHLGVTVELESFFREPTLTGLRHAVDRQRADLVSPLVEAAFAGPVDRPALVAPDGRLSYAELADLVTTAAKEADPQAEPAAVRADSSLAGAREVLAGLAAQQPMLLCDPAGTAAEQQAAWQSFTTDPLPEAARAVHAITTSGSTGQPKVVVSPNGGMLAVQRAHAGLYELGPEDSYLVMAPLHHCFGLKAGMLVGLLSGATVVLAPQPLRPESLRACAEQHRITMTIGVSFAYRILLAADAELPALRHAMVGGDPLPADVVVAWQARTAAPLINSYGCTETDHISDNIDGVADSVGRPLPGVELRVRRADGTITDTGEGELLVDSPGVAHGYAADPQRTAERFTDGWYATGDVAELRTDGHVFLRGRLDDQLNVAGTKVDPREVEQTCREALGLIDCAVLGETGATGVVEIKAYVVAEHPVTRDGLARAVSGRLSAHKIPSRVVQLDQLPRSAGGKLLRGELP